MGDANGVVMVFIVCSSERWYHSEKGGATTAVYSN